jgi:hypothetical protein
VQPSIKGGKKNRKNINKEPLPGHWFFFLKIVFVNRSGFKTSDQLRDQGAGV